MPCAIVALYAMDENTDPMKREALAAANIQELVRSLRRALPPPIGYVTRRLPVLLKDAFISRGLVARISRLGDDTVIEHYLYYLRLLLEQTSVREHLNADYFPLAWLECMLLRHHMEYALSEGDGQGGLVVDWAFLTDAKKIKLLRASTSVSRDTMICLQLLSMLSANGIQTFLSDGRDALVFLNNTLERAPRSMIRELLLMNPDFTGFLLMLQETGEMPVLEDMVGDMEYGRRMAGVIQQARSGAASALKGRGRINVGRILHLRALILETGQPARSLAMLDKAGCLNDRVEYLYLEYLLLSPGA